MNFDPKAPLFLGFVTAEVARMACARWYYRPEMPLGKLVRIGVWETGVFKGVIIFGMGASADLGTPYGLTGFECCEMVRAALDHNHKTSVSRIIAIALKLLKKQSPGLRAVVSFSDPAAGHVGTIYQAMGWIYTGTTAPDKQYIDPAGRAWHSRLASKTGWKKGLGGSLIKCAKTSECRVVKLEGKHRYVWPFDTAISAVIRQREKAYPKKTADEAKPVVAPDIPVGRGEFKSDPSAPHSTSPDGPSSPQTAASSPPVAQSPLDPPTTATPIPSPSPPVPPRPRSRRARSAPEAEYQFPFAPPAVGSPQSQDQSPPPHAP
jgi:hypothetical protein